MEEGPIQAIDQNGIRAAAHLAKLPTIPTPSSGGTGGGGGGGGVAKAASVAAAASTGIAVGSNFNPYKHGNAISNIFSYSVYYTK